MTFTVKIEMGNDAMKSRFDVARALRQLANKVNESGHMNGKIMDFNGNSVGSWEFSDGRTEKPSNFRSRRFLVKVFLTGLTIIAALTAVHLCRAVYTIWKDGEDK